MYIPQKPLQRLCGKPRREHALLPRPRIRADVVLRLRGNENVEVAMDAADRWAATASASLGIQSRRHYLVFINPASGSGLAPKVWDQSKEILGQAPGLILEVHRTSRAGEAFDLAKELDLSAYQGIIIVSGDGLVREVLCGLGEHANRTQALKMPIGHIPGGSGNGLAASILHDAGECYGVLEAAYLIAKGRVQPLDLAAVHCTGGSQRVAFLALSWAMISDIDIESEKLRCCGGFRFTLWTVWRLLRLRRYRGTVRYWPPEAGELPRGPPPSLAEPLPQEEKWRSLSGDFMVVWAMNLSKGASDALVVPDARPGDGLWHLVVVQRASRWQLLRFFLGLETGSHLAHAGAQLLTCRALRLEPEPHSRQHDGYLSLDGELVPLGPIQVWLNGCGQAIGGLRSSETFTIGAV